MFRHALTVGVGLDRVAKTSDRDPRIAPLARLSSSVPAGERRSADASVCFDAVADPLPAAPTDAPANTDAASSADVAPRTQVATSGDVAPRPKVAAPASGAGRADTLPAPAPATRSAPIEPRVEILVCATCRSEATRECVDSASTTIRDGARMLEAIDRELAACTGLGIGIASSATACLWACRRGCNLVLRSPSRAGYVLTDLEPTHETACAVVRFAALYAESASGSVPYAQWPTLLRGHFAYRIPPPTTPLSTHSGPEAL